MLFKKNYVTRINNRNSEIAVFYFRDTQRYVLLAL